MPGMLVLSIGLNFAIGVVLIRQYVRTRNAGLIWLGMAEVIWPLVSLYFRQILADIASRRFAGENDSPLGNLYLIFQLLEQLVRAGLLIVAIFYLARTNARASLPTNP
jgi:hypothetical protein